MLIEKIFYYRHTTGEISLFIQLNKFVELDEKNQDEFPMSEDATYKKTASEIVDIIINLNTRIFKKIYIIGNDPLCDETLLFLYYFKKRISEENMICGERIFFSKDRPSKDKTFEYKSSTPLTFRTISFSENKKDYFELVDLLKNNAGLKEIKL